MASVFQLCELIDLVDAVIVLGPKCMVLLDTALVTMPNSFSFFAFAPCTPDAQVHIILSHSGGDHLLEWRRFLTLGVVPRPFCVAFSKFTFEFTELFPRCLRRSVKTRGVLAVCPAPG